MTEIVPIPWREGKKLDRESGRHRADFWMNKRFTIYAGYKSTLEMLIAWEAMQANNKLSVFTRMEIIDAGSLWYKGFRVGVIDATIGNEGYTWHSHWVDRLRPIFNYAAALGCVIDGHTTNPKGESVIRTARCYRFLGVRKHHRNYTKDDGKGTTIVVNVD